MKQRIIAKRIERGIDSLANKNKNIRQQAIDQLATLGTEAIRPIVKCTADRKMSKAMKISAVETLGKIEDNEATTALIEMFNSASRQMQLAVLEALKNRDIPHNYKGKVQKLLVPLIKSGPPNIRKIALEVLENNLSGDVIGLFASILENAKSSQADAIIAIEMLEKISTKLTIGPIAHGLFHRKSEVRRISAKALGRCSSDRQVVEILEHAYHIATDDDERIAIESAIRRNKGGTHMELVPGGEFKMGSDNGLEDEKPVHSVHVDSFYIDIYPVTVRQYRKFVEATDYKQPNWVRVMRYAPTDNCPMIYVSWQDAYAYAKWVGKRLPTEAEWEKAARAGVTDSKYPWGDLLSIHHANYASNVGRTTSVGSYQPNAYGLYDMVGNVWEWCEDGYSNTFYTEFNGKNPSPPPVNRRVGDKGRVIRGGSWGYKADDLRLSRRSYGKPASLSSYVGFRCVSTPSKL